MALFIKYLGYNDNDVDFFLFFKKLNLKIGKKNRKSLLKSERMWVKWTLSEEFISAALLKVGNYIVN